MLKLTLLLMLLATPGANAADGRVIEGAFGLEFDALPAASLGASVDGSPVPIALYDITAGSMEPTDATVLPDLQWLGWHYFEPPVLPPRLVDRGMRFFALTTSTGELVMVAALLPDECGELSAFFTDSITRKYELVTESVAVTAPALAPFADIQRWSSRGRNIVLACGRVTYLLYGDTRRINAWHEDARNRSRQQADSERLQLIADVTRLLPGNDQRIHGAFGILFARPVSGHSALQKETTVRWERTPLPAPYDKATYELVLDPQGYPTRIAATFTGLSFEHMKAALEARFGAPGKSSPNHVIHKVGGDFVSLRREAAGARLAVIDHEGDQMLRERAKARAMERWQAEVKGL